MQEVKHRPASSARFKIGTGLYAAISFRRTGKDVLVKIGMDERSEGMKNGLSCGQVPWGSGVPEKEKATAPTERDDLVFRWWARPDSNREPKDYERVSHLPK
ncbi:hypothetical protein [Slackia piriformis]|uniref:hypothetical protein n=1 Tax=Slackia piriformis TaxID=626934 RepID=UPI0023F40393|nr:hypothetical protein [Slackia piriformis]